MHAYKKRPNAFVRITKGVLIVLVILAAIGWMIGFNTIRNKWNFFWYGRGSVAHVKKFYSTVGDNDSTAFLQLFSAKVMQEEGRENLIAIFRCGVPEDKWLGKHHHEEIIGKWMSGDTAVIKVAVSAGSYDKDSVLFKLLKENGDWKIVF
ncbi:MAG TPA: hypothetical protein VD993_02970 [Chitinophagaceae bacterium]|nr:hypothetical protein [Chitinophagaceae bacterium]